MEENEKNENIKEISNILEKHTLDENRCASETLRKIEKIISEGN